MKKAILAIITVVTILTNLAAANVELGRFTELNAADIKLAMPHVISKDGNMLIEERLASTDYSSMLIALANLANNNQSYRVKVSKTLTSYINLTEELFIKPEGNVVTGYDYKAEKFIPTNKFDITSAAQFALAYESILKNIDAYSYNRLSKTRLTKTAKEGIKKTSGFVLNNLYEEGRFFEDSSKSSVTIRSMANGMLSLNSLWSISNADEKEELMLKAIEIHKYLETTWNNEYEVFAFGSSNPANLKFDLRDFGNLLWGSKELADILAEGKHGYKALEVMLYTNKMLGKVLVEGATYKEAGIAREIQIVNGVASAARDEVNTGRLHNFLYALAKWNESPFTALIGTQESSFNFIKQQLMFSVTNHIDEYGIIHDTKFVDTTVIEFSKELPYINWFIAAADYMKEAHGTYFSESEITEINNAIEKNYKLLTEKFFISGAKVNKLMNE